MNVEAIMGKKSDIFIAKLDTEISTRKILCHAVGANGRYIAVMCNDAMLRSLKTYNTTPREVFAQPGAFFLTTDWKNTLRVGRVLNHVPHDRFLPPTTVTYLDIRH
jgi:hypothetical protein